MRIAYLGLGIALAGAIALHSCAAFAHGDAEWIMNGGYVDRQGIHCCGPVDCRVAQPGELERIIGGWRHVPTNTSIPDNEPGVYPSIDVQLWRCVRGEQLKCVFPGAGL